MMIVEKIFPCNYYNELSGLMTDSSIVQILLKKNFPKIFKLLEPSGGTIYLNNIINKWLLTIFIHKVSDTYANFIWDMFLLEGNIVLFKASYAFMILLEPHILNCKTFDDLNKKLNHYPLTFEKRDKLAYYLISKKFNFNMELIKKYRKKINKGVIKEIKGIGAFLKEEIVKKNKKNYICNLKSPLCFKDKKNLDQNYDNIILKPLTKPEIIEDYFYNDDDDDYNKKDNKYNEKEEDKFEDLLIERRKHFCYLVEKENSDKLINGEINDKDNNKNHITNNININNKDNIINNNNNIIKNNDNTMKDNDINIENENSLEDIDGLNDKNIGKIIKDVVKDNEEKITFEKEKGDDSIVSVDLNQ